MHTGTNFDVPSLVECPEVHIIGRSTSSIEDQWMFLECRKECIQKMGTKVFTSKGLEITDVLRIVPCVEKIRTVSTIKFENSN